MTQTKFNPVAGHQPRFELWIGDICESLSAACRSVHPDAALIDQSNLDQCLACPPSTGYTSLADIGNLQNLLDLCRCADHIHYLPPENWSDRDRQNQSKQKKWTEYVLRSVSHKVIVTTDSAIIDQQYDILRSDLLIDHRKTAAPQGWAVGCSITAGVGVQHDQGWHNLLLQRLDLQYSVLARPASSIIWQSDQICRSDLRAKDIVVWALTSPQRLPVFVNGRLVHVTTNSFAVDPTLYESVSPDCLDSADLVYQNVLAVRRAHNYCVKSGATLLIVGVLYDFEGVLYLADVPNSEMDLIWPESWIDTGSDNEHPGPMHHAHLADKFYKKYIEAIHQT